MNVREWKGNNNKVQYKSQNHASRNPRTISLSGESSD